MTARVIQCKKCARLYQSIGASPYCPNCMDELERSFDLVKNYIYDHPNANVVEISTETEVPEKDILHFLKEGRLSVSEDNGILSCEICGSAITTGRYCVSCQSKLERELTASLNDAMQKDKKPSSKGKMHINLRDR